ncbi:MAG: RNA 2'-phosphotransferase [Pseudomonadota bacterium]
MPKDDPLTRASKFLSLVLRHQPQTAGLNLDSEGWAEIDALLAGAPRRLSLDRGRLDEIVATNNKKRFEISACGARIRAVQGHSVAVDLALAPITPPETLYHGTATRFLKAIMAEGLRPGNRRHVHLSADWETARAVGTRHGVPAILHVAAARAASEGQSFYRAANGVWLTDPLAPSYLSRRA